jgi:hypothetical protein
LGRFCCRVGHAYNGETLLAERYGALIQQYILSNGTPSDHPADVPEGDQPSLPAAGGTP